MGETPQIEVTVETEFLPGHSDPARNFWFFAYHISIHNRTNESVQLLSRHWIITDAHGHTEHVRGPGVVGDQPVIRPGGEYKYSSGCPLNTSMGSMEGTYQMVDANGRQFDAEIPAFVLVDPLELN